jgi:hypothetical protein
MLQRAWVVHLQVLMQACLVVYTHALNGYLHMFLHACIVCLPHYCASVYMCKLL